MAVTFTGTDRFPAVLAAAKAVAGGEIGTEHLLIGLASAAPTITHLLDAFDVTPTVLRAVLAAGTIRDGEAPDVEAVVLSPAVPLTGAANTALIRCAAYHPGPSTPDQVLSALLADTGSGATAALRACGADVGEIRRALFSSRQITREDRLPGELRPVRDKLIGRDRYRGRGLRDFLMSAVVRDRVNYAVAPVLWASLEADDAARRRGGPTRTDDVLYAMVTTGLVAEAYPHLVGDATAQYEGTRELLADGLDRRRLAAVIAAETGADEVPLKSLLRAGPEWPRDTAHLLRLLDSHPGTRAARVLRAFGAGVPLSAGSCLSAGPPRAGVDACH
ncbi:Clp protease N-terminal domain-containing protein [Actinoplanes sp. DH11]|uniref:Clp protease N-terminal domain-containing protein n=1 Tax=Actinoplanes sp. DH11 TaxID=2857011 RepID=UPI001E5300CB|nr:Clp protease N-terminal domain-containing protein [Actinoplanes sp. DH11]